MALPLIPIALGVGAWYWWKKSHGTQNYTYTASNGSVYNLVIDGNMPGPVAAGVGKDIAENVDIASLSADQAWLAASGYPIAANLVSSKIMQLQVANAQAQAAQPKPAVTSGSIWR